MKPNTTSSLSALGYVGLLILFNLPYVGFPAIILFSIFAKDRGVRGLARAFLIIELAVIAILAVLCVIGLMNFGEIFGDYYFVFSEGGVEAFNNIGYLLGA